MLVMLVMLLGELLENDGNVCVREVNCCDTCCDIFCEIELELMDLDVDVDCWLFSPWLLSPVEKLGEKLLLVFPPRPNGEELLLGF